MKISLIKKVSLSLGVAAGLGMLAEGVVYKKGVEVGETQKWVVHTNEVIADFNGVLLALVNIETGQRGYLVSGSDGFLAPYVQGKADFERLHAKLSAATSDNANQTARLAQIKEKQTAWLKAADAEIDVKKKVLAGRADEKDLVETFREAKGKAQMDSMRELLAAAVKEEADLNVIRGQAYADAVAMQNFMLIGAAFMILSGIGISLMVIARAVKQIQLLANSLFASSNEVNGAAGAIAGSSEGLSQSTTEQAAALEETAASVEELSSMVRQNSGNAEATAATSKKSQEKASEGKMVVGKMIESVSAIDRSNQTIMAQVNRSNESIGGIVKVIEEIGTKTKVINDIVFQTKLLSFNASVEAARAGEHGKGFAVVAEEVGSLAQMSGNAAKEISALLEESVHRVNQIVRETKDGVEATISQGKASVEEGVSVARHCGEVLEDIVRDVASVSEMATQIASASREQAHGVTEITKAMSQLDQVTQQNSGTSQACAASSSQLSSLAESLKNSVQLLLLEINGEVTEPSQQNSPRGTSRPNNVMPFPGRAPKARAAEPGAVPSSDHPGFKEA